MEIFAINIEDEKADEEWIKFKFEEKENCYVTSFGTASNGRIKMTY
jgi:hypothetical protein